MTNRHWIDLQVLYDSVLDQKVVFTVTCLGKNGLVGRDFFYHYYFRKCTYWLSLWFTSIKFVFIKETES